MTGEPFDLDALEKICADLDYHNERDFAGNQVIVMDFQNAQRLKQIEQAIPRLIELARLGQEADKPQQKPVWFDGLYWQKKDE